MLDRDGGEVARATTIVRYAAGARFPTHIHGGGEEFYVLDGVFEDEHGAYPAGTYVRNPPGSRHAPFTDAGCSIFVKLHQFQPGDDARVVIDTREADWLPGAADGVSVLPLHAFESEQTALVRFAPGAAFKTHRHPGGEEILILDGVLEDEFGSYSKGSWLRNAPMSRHAPFSREGCVLLVKVGHLDGIAQPRPAPSQRRKVSLI
jgi:anti-sigma factor ChrR (cupin superfamily)